MVFQRVAEVVQRIVPDFRVVVQQQQVAPLCGTQSEVVASGKTQVALAADRNDTGKAFREQVRFVAQRSRCRRR